VGAAEAGYRASLIPELQSKIEGFEEDEVVLVCSGEGATSGGEFWEALNTACNLKLPVVFLIEDNGYAISVPVEVNTPGGSISKLVSGFPDLFIIECDGTDVLDSHQATGKAVRHCRLRRGPALVHSHTIRPYSHSISDDERAYRAAAELEEAAARDPLVGTRNLLIARGLATAEELDHLEEEAESEVAVASVEASRHPQPHPEAALLHLYSEEVDPSSASFDTEDSQEFGDERALTMVDSLNACLRDEMERDPRVILFGQDIADASREPALAEVKGRGGCSRSRTGSNVDSVGAECSTRLWPRPTSSDEPSAWPSGVYGPWSRSSSSITSGQRSCKFETSWPPCGIAPRGRTPHRW
jgi:2-oxoisovalerate dehydrogenase E1 component